MSPAVEAFLKQRFDVVLKELTIRINDFPPPSKSVRLDLIAIDKSQSLIVECKKYSTPYHIGVGIGEILIQRAILRREKTKIEKRERIQIPEPIRLGLCCSDFTKCYNEFPDGYRWKTWNQSCADLLRSLTRDLEESTAILLMKSKVVKPSYRELLSSDLYVERVV